MNYTAKYHLPQWVESDRIMMKDFNQMCADIEAGLLSGVAGSAEGAAKVQENVDKVQAAADKAQATADKAVADAARAQAKADAAYSPSQPPYTVGTYTGTNAKVTVKLGFQPKFLIITAATSGTLDLSYIAIAAPGLMTDHVQFTSTGFTVYPLKYNSTGVGVGIPIYPDLSSSGGIYSYIAFR